MGAVKKGRGFEQYPTVENVYQNKFCYLVGPDKEGLIKRFTLRNLGDHLCEWNYSRGRVIFLIKYFSKFYSTAMNNGTKN